MTILAFWHVGYFKVERHTLDNVSDLDAFDILWHKRDELNARFYHVDSRGYTDPLSQYGILSASDFEEDYNNEELDGGHWTRVMHLDREDVKQVIND